MKRFLMIAGVFLFSLSAVFGFSDEEAKKAEASAQKLFDAMAEKNADSIKALFAPEATLLAVIKRPDGTSMNRTFTSDAFATMIAGNKGTLKEVMPKPEVKMDGGLALVWGRYVFVADGKLSHCGVNSFHMVKTADGWKIGNAATTIDPGSCTEEEKKMAADIAAGK